MGAVTGKARYQARKAYREARRAARNGGGKDAARALYLARKALERVEVTR